MSIENTPEANTLFFVWFNQYSGILLKTPTKTIIVDPVDIKAKNIPVLDAILITHEHYDHLDPPLVTAIQKNTGCCVIADPISTKKLQITIPNDKLHEIKPGTEIKVGAVIVRAEKSNHPAKAPNTYIITSEDGVKIYHTSDSAPFPELAQIAEKEQFDLVFCTVGIAPGASPQTGFEIASLTKPPLVVPYHTASTASQEQFAELIKQNLNRTTCLIPQQNQIYQIAKRM
ncbi:MAG: MBL fold metallo-hydrolase [Candidatus Bathyarchaeia archaeon]|jgi:L-ascorbate metabolism protein UlaG (beta-lactamase superfamily)